MFLDKNKLLLTSYEHDLGGVLGVILTSKIQLNVYDTRTFKTTQSPIRMKKIETKSYRIVENKQNLDFVYSKVFYKYKCRNCNNLHYANEAILKLTQRHYKIVCPICLEKKLVYVGKVNLICLK